MKISKKILAYRGILIMMLCMAFFVLGGSTAFAKWIGIEGAVSTYDTYFRKVWYESDGKTAINDWSELPEVTINLKLEKPDNDNDIEDKVATKTNAKRTKRSVEEEQVTLSTSNNWNYTLDTGNQEGTKPTKVEEVDIPGFKSEITFTVNKEKQWNQFIVKNTRIDTSTGDITISKTVSGAEPDMDKAFDFKIELDDDTVDGTYRALEFVDGM